MYDYVVDVYDVPRLVIRDIFIGINGEDELRSIIKDKYPDAEAYRILRVETNRDYFQNMLLEAEFEDPEVVSF